MRWKILCIAVCLLALKPAGGNCAESCRACHRLAIQGAHAAVACTACHGEGAEISANPAGAAEQAKGCSGCHRGYASIFQQPMATREAERRFVAATYGKEDLGFYAANCGSCHLTGCLACHGASGHAICKPAKEACLRCHRGYFTGADYYGKAPREEHQRYQRGGLLEGEPYLKMLPDVHAERGMACGACHTMSSLASGKKAAKGCTDCHTPNRKVLEHSIPAHLSKLECYACHAAWAPQEYGTFFLRFDNSPVQEEFDLRENRGAYVKSVFLKRQDAPPLGINSQGKVSPIRPEFIAYFSALSLIHI